MERYIISYFVGNLLHLKYNCALKKLKTNLVFLRRNLFYMIDSRPIVGEEKNDFKAITSERNQSCNESSF